MPNNSKQREVEIREEFERKFGDKIYGEKPLGAIKVMNEIADFILAKISEAREEGRREVDKIIEAEILEVGTLPDEAGEIAVMALTKVREKLTNL